MNFKKSNIRPLSRENSRKESSSKASSSHDSSNLALSLERDSDEHCLSYAKRILVQEAEAIQRTSEILDQGFDQAVQLILQLPKDGRVIVSGIGKAGFIGMKISATLASTGVKSFFLHPAEAVHGDLGRFASNDIALILSHSGETAEIIRILQSIKRTGCPIIAITANHDSSLAKHSDAVISMGKLAEAGPLGLAPTTSTAVMLALGDALAMSVLNRQNFSKEQFALYHPGGSLGRKLTTISEVMRSGDENAVVSQDLKVRDVLHSITIAKGCPGAAAIIDDQGILVGVFTDGDLRRLLENGVSFLDLEIKEVMGKTPKTLEPEKLVEEALHLLSKHKIDQLIVVDKDNKPVGLVDIQDIVEWRG